MALKIRFVVVGMWNTLFSFAMFAGLLYWLGDSNYREVFIASAIVSVLQSYITQKVFVWRSKEATKVELPRFILVYLISGSLNYLLLQVLVEVFDSSPLLGQLTISAGIVLISFVIHKRWTFAST